MPNLKRDFDPYSALYGGRGNQKDEHVVFGRRGNVRVIAREQNPDSMRAEAQQYWLDSHAIQNTWEAIRLHPSENMLPLLDAGGPGEWLFFLARLCPSVQDYLEN